MLDNKDKKIIFELDQDSKQPVSTLSKKIRLNKNTTHFRIQRLIKEEYITGFYPTIDISRLGYYAFRVYFRFFSASETKEKEIISYLVKDKNCGVVAELESVYDVMFMFITNNTPDFEQFWNSFKKKFRAFIWDERIHLITSVIHLKRKYLNEDNKNIHNKLEIVGGNKPVKFDQKDLIILSQLAKNCRQSALDIFKTTKIPPRTIIHKIKKMEKRGIIQGYRVNLNLEKINREYYKVNFNLSKMDEFDELIEYCKTHSNVTFIDNSLSNYDLEIDLEVKNKNELVKMINEIKNKFSSIRIYEIIPFKKYLKIESIPHLN